MKSIDPSLELEGNRQPGGLGQLRFVEVPDGVYRFG
jgi:hypothetical protein